MSEGGNDNELPPEGGEEQGGLTPQHFLGSDSGTNAPGSPLDTMAELPPEETPSVPSDLQPLEGLPDLGELPAPTELTPSELPSLEDSSLPIPEEITDPNLSVDDMLAAAVAGELGLPTAEAGPAPVTPAQPTFELRFPPLDEGAAQGLKKAAEALQITLTPETFAAPAPVISRLGEYQAVALLQAARALGLEGRALVYLPEAGPSEEDLALGELLAVAEPESPVQKEAAPAVELPKGEKDVLLCTPDQLPGGMTRETFGIVITHRSIARRLFREEEVREKLEKELKTVPSKAATAIPSSLLQLLLRELFLDLRKAALAKGANAVLGVKLEAFPESSTSDPQLQQLRLVAFGTAAVVEKPELNPGVTMP